MDVSPNIQNGDCRSGALTAVALVAPALSVGTQADGTASLVVDPVRLAVQAAVTSLVSAAYFVLGWCGPRRATPFQRLLGLAVVRAADGGSLRAGRSLVRWVALGGPLGFLWALLVEQPVLWLFAVVLSGMWAVALVVSARRGARRRGLHDRIGGSVVIG